MYNVQVSRRIVFGGGSSKIRKLCVHIYGNVHVFVADHHMGTRRMRPIGSIAML